MGQYTEGWGSTQRGGAVHRGVGQFTEGRGSTQRGVAVHRGVGQYTYASTSFRSQLTYTLYTLFLLYCRLEKKLKNSSSLAEEFAFLMRNKVHTIHSVMIGLVGCLTSIYQFLFHLIVTISGFFV